MSMVTQQQERTIRQLRQQIKDRTGVDPIGHISAPTPSSTRWAFQGHFSHCGQLPTGPDVELNAVDVVARLYRILAALGPAEN
jgi:hypothetical protein